MQDRETANGENHPDTLCWVLPRTRSGFGACRNRELQANHNPDWPPKLRFWPCWLILHSLIWQSLTLAGVGGFWRPLDFEGVPKSTIFIQNQNILSKHGDQERCLKKNEIMMERWCEKEVPWDVKKMFSHYNSYNLKGSAGRETWWKIVLQKASEISQNWQLWGHWARF